MSLKPDEKKKETFTDRINTLYAEYQERQIKNRLRSSEGGFGKIAGLSRQCIHEYLNKKNKLPDGSALLKLCNAHGVSADWLLGLSDDRSVEMDFKAAYKKLGLSEEAANTLFRYQGPALNLFLSKTDSWETIMHDLGGFYACKKYMDDHPHEATTYDIPLSYQGSTVLIGVNDSVNLLARRMADRILLMLENISTTDMEK